ncbi:MAG: transcriptional regulator [Bacillota bacterium]|nr:transcriptional regulator [Bacillota bacterium]
MFFNFGIKNKTVKELRKNQCLTVKELAQQLKLDVTKVLAVDHLKLKEVPEPLQKRMLPILRGDNLDKIPW